LTLSGSRVARFAVMHNAAVHQLRATLPGGSNVLEGRK
jgi:hypothetical protein